MPAPFFQNGIARDPMDGVIAFTAGGAETQQLVPAPGDGLAIQVLSYVYTCPSGAGLIWKSGSTAKSGTLKPTIGISVPSPGPGGRQFQCGENQALNVTVDTAGVYGGHFLYQLVEVD